MKTLTEEQIKERLEKLEYWDLEEGFLVTSLDFKDFADAFAMMTRIAFEAEALQHHPEWSNVYNNLTIRLNTHDADGITEKDFKLATRIEEIIKG
ncbi:4a-hydroxytetrahydrobiopterin dehydratase [Galbibacter orientalis]|jgi:4a-hydroxytetrahydrobiopterin dehydratase|uniref:Putative pterin-4-alpha-carbinolamine dehydratase n=1 Tax=Galbibacter orientalis DSM 19592 TaxID=926559 RepID=I3C0N7_9FLAO|nr:4a-hydroxytetrahydrobiopterin dehydratase [Galbibacter orientalis]EIJ37180.1 pterin-4a-carbinolamine dehydratase [Galbibacter orientalis DSM 19592]